MEFFFETSWAEAVAMDENEGGVADVGPSAGAGNPQVPPTFGSQLEAFGRLPEGRA
jgi:hypothetical protein